MTCKVCGTHGVLPACILDILAVRQVLEFWLELFRQLLCTRVHDALIESDRIALIQQIHIVYLTHLMCLMLMCATVCGAFSWDVP